MFQVAKNIIVQPLLGLTVILILQGCSLYGNSESPTSATLNRLDTLPMETEVSDNGPADISPEGEAGPNGGFEKRGTGQVVASALPSVKQWQASGDGVDLNFQNADIRAVADVIFGKILKAAYSVDPAIDGRISLQTGESLPRPALLMAFESALDTVGGRLVFDGVTYHIKSAAADDFPGGHLVGLSSKDIKAGYGLHILPLKHVSADRIMDIIEPFVPVRAKVTVEPERNLLVIAGTGPERMSLIDMISVFDVDWMQGMSYGLYPLEAANATDVIRELETLFATASGDTAPNAVQFLPVERMNAIMVIAVNPDLLERSREWITELDHGGQSSGNRLYVYKVQNGRARDLATVLGGIFGAEQHTLGNNSTVAPGLTPKRLSSGTDNRNQDTSEHAGRTSSAMSTLGEARNSQQEAQVSFVADNLRIIADDRNNALLIMASQQDYRLIKSSLKQLDIEPLQVMIEATVAEVKLNNDLRYGLQWFFQEGDFDLTLSDADTGTVASSFPGFSAVFDDPDARAVLNALDSVTDVEIVSSPQLMVLNNQTAILQVGDEVPVPVQSATSTENSNPLIVNSIDYRDTGVILRVTPRVNSSGMVLIDVEQEVSNVVETLTSGIDAPTIQQRYLASTIAVKSGATIALGGLIQHQISEEESGVPVISKIPLMGNLFKTTGYANKRTELLVLITPRVIGSTREAQEVTKELRERLSRIAPAAKSDD
ncbi:type II secretion system secretin GspD [Emcibacter nanhaiensis]|uniref:Type II secretion system protein GspD n=1 Tax=Emcibacter nanhaiensis TaxID=1505037 RepID=A0A501PJT4_9PROT|nr:type II secretion system secretin GspD [Emcibacter nanhaiensis]TPD60164.1 type II secretion system protein GspD [Emcibacter nanhaiensis]